MGRGQYWSEHRIEYEKFLKEYNHKHARCPKCGELGNYKSIRIASIFDTVEPEKYKDLNKCICKKCKDNHIIHDRLSEF